MAEALLINIQELVSRQLIQLNTMTVPGLIDAVAITLRREQYTCYMSVKQNILVSTKRGRCFFIASL
jgi:hypothetical protein